MEKKPTKQKDKKEDRKKPTNVKLLSNDKLLSNSKALYAGIGIVALIGLVFGKVILATGVLSLLGYGAGKFNKYLEGRKV